MPMSLADYAGMGTGGGFSPNLPSQESGSEFQSSDVTQEIARWCEAAFEEAKSDQQQCEEIQEIDKYVDYLRGKQWPEGRPSYRAKPINNRMSRLFWELTALLTDIKPVCDIRATERSKNYIDQEDILNKTTRAWWRNNRVDSKVAMTIVYAILTTGFAKICWDENLQFGEGDLSVIPVSPRCILPLKPGTDLQSSEAVIYQDVKGVGWVRRKYPNRAYAVFPDQDVSQFQSDGGAPGNVSPQLFQMLTPAFKRVLGSKNRQSQSSAYPMCRYREFWIKDYCVSPSTRVLTASLEWKRADELKAGDALVGCDEEYKKARTNKCRWLRRSTIENIARLRQPCLRIVTDKGVVDCSTQHRWLSTTSRNNRYEWKHSDHLKVGDKIAFLAKPWEEEKTKDAGYLAGLFDGEGWANRYQIGFAQKTSGDNAVVFQRGIDLLEQRGYDLCIDRAHKSGVGRVQINGGRGENLRFIGSIRPPRLVAKSSRMWEGKLLCGKGAQAARILSIEEIGEQDVISIQTDERTFIAEGFVSHNSINTADRVVRMGPAADNDRYRIGYDVPPMMRLYPRGRLIVMAGRNIVHDGPNPYWHGFFPFAMCRLNVVPWQLYGMSDLKSWKDLQDIVNQIFAGVIDMIKRAVNPPLFFPSNAIGESARAGIDLSMPGAKVAYSQTAAHEPKVQQTAQLPGFVLQFLQGTEREMDQQSGIATVDEAMRKKQVPGGETLDQIRNSKQTPIRMKGRNIEDFISDCGMQMVPNFFQFYDRDRRVFLLGSAGSQPQDVDWKAKTMVPPDADPSVHIRKFRFEIVEGSLLSIQRVEKVLYLSKLRLAGDLDRKTFFQMLDRLENVYIDVDTVEKNLKAERAEGLMGMPPKGKKGQQPAKVQ